MWLAVVIVFVAKQVTLGEIPNLPQTCRFSVHSFYGPSYKELGISGGGLMVSKVWTNYKIQILETINPPEIPSLVP